MASTPVTIAGYKTWRPEIELSEIVFQPYVGPAYRESSVRLLILGESHHGTPDPAEQVDPADSTRRVVRNWISREWPIRYLTIAARILTGLEAWQIDRSRVFDAVAFYNFIQFIMPHVSIRPTQDQALASRKAFFEVLAALDPTHVIATGQGLLWSSMPPTAATKDYVTVAGVDLRYREYLTPSGAARTMAINHLSRASAPRWRPPVVEFLALPPLMQASAPAA